MEKSSTSERDALLYGIAVGFVLRGLFDSALVSIVKAKAVKLRENYNWKIAIQDDEESENDNDPVL